MALCLAGCCSRSRSASLNIAHVTRAARRVSAAAVFGRGAEAPTKRDDMKRQLTLWLGNVTYYASS